MTQAQQKLIDDHKRLIEQEVRRYSTHIPEQQIRIEAYKLAQEQARDFKESSGVKFSTFLTNQLQKLTRLSTTYGSLVRMPEARQFRLSKVQKVKHELQAILGREPTVSEIQDKAHIPLAEVSSLLHGNAQAFNLEDSVNQAVFTTDQNDEWLHFVYHDLPSRDKLIFEHITGFNGKPVMTQTDIQAHLGVSSATLSKRVQFIREKIEEGINA